MSKLRDAREAAGLTREQLATQAQTSISTVARMELSNHTPSFRTLEAIAAVLGIPVTEIVPQTRRAA